MFDWLFKRKKKSKPDLLLIVSTTIVETESLAEETKQKRDINGKFKKGNTPWNKGKKKC